MLMPRSFLVRTRCLRGQQERTSRARVKVLAASAISTNRSRRQQAEIFIAVEQDECGCLELPDRVQFGGLNPQRTPAIDTPSLACFLQATQQS